MAMAREEGSAREPFGLDGAGDVEQRRLGCCCSSRRSAAGRCAFLRGGCRRWIAAGTCLAFLAAGFAFWLRRPAEPSRGPLSATKGDITARAVTYAKLAGASYCTVNDLTNWSCGFKCIPGVSNVHTCQGDTTKAYVAKWEGACVVSIMGSQEYISMVRDLEIYKSTIGWDGCRKCYVHEGFFYEWKSMEKCIVGSLEAAGCKAGHSNVRVTGHSLGGGVGALAMMALQDKGWHVEEGWTFGMPRTGDENFAKEFTHRFRDKFYRVTHHMDPVVHVPPSELIVDWHWQHVEPELFYDGNNTAGHKVCSEDNDMNCSGQYYDELYDVFHISDHMVYMDMKIGTPGCGVNASHLDSMSGAGRGHGGAA